MLCDVYEEPGDALVAVAPRTILKRQLERAAAAGFVPMGASELEFFILRETYESAQQKGFDRPRDRFGWYIEDYHTLQGFKVEPLVGAIRRHLDELGRAGRVVEGRVGPGPARDQPALRRLPRDGRPPRRSTSRRPRRSPSSRAWR